MSAVLACSGITVRFGGVVACDNVAVSVERGQVAGLIGPNGAGKTTLFNVLSRFQVQDAGDVLLDGENVNGRRPHEMVSLGMTRTFQNINLFGQQSVLDNILVGAHRHIGNPLAAIFSLPGSRGIERRLVARATEIAELLRLSDELDNAVRNLPYGLQKRVELARALAASPSLLLLDEPVAGCNEEETAELTALVRRINREMGVTILLVEHDMSMVMSVCDTIHVISFGANLASGTPAEIRSNRDVIKAYLGEAEEQ